MPAPAEPFGFAELGQDVLAIMDHAGIGRAHFCGLSMGGMTGMWLAASHPERASGASCSANTAALIGPASGWDTRIQTVRAQGMAAIVDAVLARWFSAGWLAGNASASPRCGRCCWMRRLKADTANCAAVRVMPTCARCYRASPARVLVIAGTLRSWRPRRRQGREVAEGIAGARYLEHGRGPFVQLGAAAGICRGGVWVPGGLRWRTGSHCARLAKAHPRRAPT
ncbi:alpha/beta fold hydrolase [Cupriavidus basilensis]